MDTYPTRWASPATEDAITDFRIATAPARAVVLALQAGLLDPATDFWAVALAAETFADETAALIERLPPR